MIKLRDICNISIEEKRASKEIGSSLEADLNIKLNTRYKELLKDTDISELCITSNSNLIFDDQYDIITETKKASGEKCPVCWKISTKPCLRHKQ